MEDRRISPDKYKETKKRYVFGLTDDASIGVDYLANQGQVTRSEAIEQLLRHYIAEHPDLKKYIDQTKNTKKHRVSPKKYSQIKSQKQFMLTPTASSYLDAIANFRSQSRGETLEQLIRESAL